MTGLSRRTFIAGAGACILSGVQAGRAFAFSKMQVGDGELTVVSDGGLMQPLKATYPDVDEGELKALLAANSLPIDMLKPDCNVTFLKRGDRLIAFDAGAGANFMASAGKLAANMAEAGIDPAAVTDVIFTHAHPDHLWGIQDEFDELLFANAAYRISQAEWDFWSSPDAMNNVPEERKAFVAGAQNRFGLIKERISFFKPGDEVAPGVEAVDTNGHTAGHVSFMVHGGEGAMIVGDAIASQFISLEKPDWPTASDHDPEAGIKTRLKLLDRLVSDKSRVIGYHFVHPGAGRIERKDLAFRLAAD